MPRLSDCYNSEDFAQAARRRLPAPLYHYIEGGADDEVTLRANTAAFDRYSLQPNYLRDIRTVDTKRTVLGRELAWPLVLSPTGMTKMFHPGGEIAVARAAAASGAMYSLSTMATTSIEAVAAASPGPKLFQLYLLNDDALNLAMIDRARDAGFDAICLTVDTIVAGNRERDLRHGLTVPPRLNIAGLAGFAVRPGWCLNYISGGRFSLPNIALAGESERDVSTLAAYFAQNMAQYISWQRLERLVAHWGGPFAVKGLQAVTDARLAANVGATAVIVSNHGGRQLDGSPATIDIVADIVDAVGDRIEVLLDGGVRRGTHIIKALAMGVRACMMGRPYLYALASYGEPGVTRLLSILKAETQRTLALLGCANVDELDRTHLRAADAWPAFLTDESTVAPPPAQWKLQS